MNKKATKLVQQGEYVAEVEVELETTDHPCSPYLNIVDAEKLDKARLAIRSGDLQAVKRYGRVFQLMPVGG